MSRKQLVLYIYFMIIGGIFLISICVFVFIYFLFKKKKTLPKAENIQKEDKLFNGLVKTRLIFLSNLDKFFKISGGAKVSAEQLEEMEEKLLSTDMGLKTITVLLEKIKNSTSLNGHSIGELIQNQLVALFEGMENGFNIEKNYPKPYVINIVGVNGVGKTTTIGKLAEFFRNQGRTVIIGAADTFRAGAIAQLRVWAERSRAQFVGAKEGQDPGAVVYDTLCAAKAKNIDAVLLDTAGRLHTKLNLMEELKKISRVIQKVIPNGPHEIWLVIDGTFGQNVLIQAKEFQKALGITGVIITKLDGTAKGGAVFSIAHELQLPIKFIGVGEGLTDLLVFEPKSFVGAIFNEKPL